MEEKSPHAEEVEGPEFPGDPTAREAPAMRIREEVAAPGERMVGGGWWFQNKTPPRPSIIGHDPPGAEIPDHPGIFPVFPRPRADSVYPQALGTILCQKI